MKAMVFAAGMGTRLRPLTDNCPKALVEIGGTPMLEHVIRNLKAAGFNEIVVNVHYLGKMIVDFLRANNGFGCTIHISDESGRLLDTGGGIFHARQWLDGSEPFMVHNADIITDLDLRAMYDAHIDSGADSTLLVADRQTSRYLLFSPDDRLHGWINIGSGETRPAGFVFDPDRYHKAAFGGIHVISPTIFRSLSEYSQKSNDGVFSIIQYYLSECDRLKFVGYMPDAPYRWCDIGKMETLRHAEQIFGNG